ncbi:hypothetical protein LEMLEM_LOCUS27213, partial [Lemmus lemmus]
CYFTPKLKSKSTNLLLKRDFQRGQAVWSPVYVTVPPAFNVCLPPSVKQLWKHSHRHNPNSTPEMMIP